jgi:hypothetical protein
MVVLAYSVELEDNSEEFEKDVEGGNRGAFCLGPIQPIIWVPGALFLGVKRPEREADHSLPSSPEVKNAWSYTSTPQYVFIVWCSTEAQGSE